MSYEETQHETVSGWQRSVRESHEGAEPEEPHDVSTEDDSQRDLLPSDLRSKIHNVLDQVQRWSTQHDTNLHVAQPGGAAAAASARLPARMPAGGLRMQQHRMRMAAANGGNLKPGPAMGGAIGPRSSKRLGGPSHSNISTQSSGSSAGSTASGGASGDLGSGLGAGDEYAYAHGVTMGKEVNAYIASLRQMSRHYEDQRTKYQESVTSETSDRTVHLPRGGIYVRTKIGAIQFGCPPETIKDSMKNNLPLPTYFVIPHERFDKDQGINVAEFEFPAYFNFFIKRQKIVLIVHREAEAIIRKIFQLTLLGPDHVDKPSHYSKAVPESAYPDLVKEMGYFRINPFDKTPLTVDTLLDFVYFDEETQEAVLTMNENSVRIRDLGNSYQVWEDDQMIEIPSRVMLTSHHPFLVERRKRMEEQRAREGANANSTPGESFDKSNYFVPPHFGVTFLGVSDGFDPHNTATGMVIWMNRRGIMVDPPPQSPHLLQAYNIHPKLIRGVILTHCHADHDAGTFQKILEEGRVVLITTRVIKECFIEKYAAISDLGRDFLETLFVFREAFVGEKLTVYGGELEFFYALHSIPCVGFSATCNGKSLIYSGDTMNDPATIMKLRDMGIMTPERADKLINFPWHQHDLILHEAGVPPIHTPMTTLTSLPPEIRKKIRVVHTNPAKFPKECGLQMAIPGPEHSITISPDPAPNAFALEILDLVGALDWFSDMPISRAAEMVQSAKRLEFKKGEDVITQGDTDKLIYFMSMGIVGVYIDGKFIRNMAVGDHFGEMALVNAGSVRTATIRALTESVEVIAFEDSDFLHLVRGTKAIGKLLNLSRHQQTDLWRALSCNATLNKLTSSQRNAFVSKGTMHEIQGGEPVWKAGDPVTCAILIASGSFFYYGGSAEEARELFHRMDDMEKKEGVEDGASHCGIQLFKRGVLVGEMNQLTSPYEERHVFTLTAKETGRIMKISKADFLSFCNENPGFIVSTMDRLFVE